ELLPDGGLPTLPADAAGHEETWRDVLRRQDSGLEPRSFEAISAPVLMLHGAEDPHPGAMIRDSLLPYVPQLEYVEITRCGHEPWRERQGRASFLGALGAWLAERQPYRGARACRSTMPRSVGRSSGIPSKRRSAARTASQRSTRAVSMGRRRS